MGDGYVNECAVNAHGWARVVSVSPIRHKGSSTFI